MKKILVFSLFLCVLASCKVARFVYYNFADITDHKIFPARQIEHDSTAIFSFVDGTDPALSIKMKKGGTFDEYLEANHTVAFMMIHKDTILYEKYFGGYDRSSTIASFSMAKSFTSFLIGCAIEDNLITSVQDPVTKYIPELKESGFDKVSIENVLQMTSGLDFNESYSNPFGHAATFYYGRNLEKATLKLKRKNEPSVVTDYTSGNTQILGLILTRVLKGKTVAEYLEEKLWKEVGMAYDASWSIDKKEEGIEKTFCCLNARPIDFAKFGRLYLHKGNWNGKQIISESWVEKSTQIDTTNGSEWGYQYQWWIPNKEGDFIAEGILGQFIYVSPSEELIIVRMGEKYGEVQWERTFEALKKVISARNKHSK